MGIGGLVELRIQFGVRQTTEIPRCIERMYANVTIPDGDVLLQVVHYIRLHVHALGTVGAIAVSDEQRVDL